MLMLPIPPCWVGLWVTSAASVRSRSDLSLNRWKVILCTPCECMHERFLLMCSLPKHRSLDPSFHQLMEVKGEHDESNSLLVLHREPLSKTCRIHPKDYGWHHVGIMFTFQRPTTTPDSSRRSSTSLSSPMSCRLFERFISTMKDLEDGLREMGAFPWWKDKNLRYELPSLSYGSRPGHLRAIRRTPWSRKLKICCRSDRWPPPSQQSATLVPQKRAQLRLLLVFCPLLS